MPSPPDHTCPNCDTVLHGVYCHECGQKAETSVPRFREFLHEAISEFLLLDGKFLNTVKVLVTQPGQITKDFIDGRRTRYISPLRLYVIFSVLFFLLAAVVPGDFIQISSTTTDAASDDEFADRILTNLPRVMFLLMPVFAVWTLAFYRRSQRYYFAHLYYSVHFHSFMFLLLTVAALLSLAGTYGGLIGSLWVPLSILYHFKALKLFFGETWGKTIWKGLAVGALYWVCLAAAMLILILVSLF